MHRMKPFSTKFKIFKLFIWPTLVLLFWRLQLDVNCNRMSRKIKCRGRKWVRSLPTGWSRWRAPVEFIAIGNGVGHWTSRKAEQREWNGQKCVARERPNRFWTVTTALEPRFGTTTWFETLGSINCLNFRNGVFFPGRNAILFTAHLSGMSC